MLSLFKKLNNNMPEKAMKVTSAQTKGAKQPDINVKQVPLLHQDSYKSKKSAIQSSQRRTNTSAFDSEH